MKGENIDVAETCFFIFSLNYEFRSQQHFEHLRIIEKK